MSLDSAIAHLLQQKKTEEADMVFHRFDLAAVRILMKLKLEKAIVKEGQ